MDDEEALKQRMSGPISEEEAVEALRRGEYERSFPAFCKYPADTMSCAWNVTLAHSRNDPPQCREQARWLHWAGGCAKRGISFPEDSACALCWAALKHEPGSAERMLQLRLAAANEDVVEVVTTPLERADKAARALAAYELSLEAGSEAADWLERAAKGGDDCAQNDLGDRYAKGKHVVRDDAAAARWFRQAAEQGNDTAQTNLGSLYFLGRGVSRDHAEAAAWFRRAAQQGNDTAQIYLGTLYAEGLGVARDDQEAAKLFMQVAETRERLRAWSE